MGKPKHPKVYSKNQIKKIKESGKLVAEVLRLATALCQEGKTTLSIDKSIDNFIKKNKAKSIKGYKNYTFNSCISIDEVILHGIPSKTKIKEGMIVNIDCPILYKGMWADGAVNVEVGKVSESKKELNRVSFECLMNTIKIIKPGITIGEICKFQEEYVTNHNYEVIKTFRGHGVGRELHEPPFIPYFYDKTNPYNEYKVREGNVFTLEPTIVTEEDIILLDDNWSYKTKNDSFGTYWEHTILVTDSKAEIVTKLSN